MRKRLHVCYSGMVQGVGFRFTAESVANSLNLAGWVKNRSDGRVEVVCEGEESALISFVSEINSGPMKNCITSTDIDWEEPRNEFKDFNVKF